MARHEPAVSVVIPARNAEATLGRTLDALAAQEVNTPFEVIVVDDGSTDRTARIATEHGVGATLVSNRGARGPGRARNCGVARATAKNIAFTDSDCFPSPSWLAAGLRALEDLDLAQGRVLPDPHADRGPFDRTVNVNGESGYYETANLFIRRSVFSQIGGFEDWVVEGGDGVFGWRAPSNGRTAPATKRTIGEDVLLGWEARRLGARVGFAKGAVVHHAVFPMSSSQAIRYRWAYRHLPALARRIPEMRGRAFYRNWFLDRRTAFFDVALAGAVCAVVTRRPTFLVFALPYARWVWQEASAWPRDDFVRVAGTRVAIDGVAFIALAVGSVGWRSLLI